MVSKASPSRRRSACPVNGSTFMALSEDDLFCNFYDKANSESFCNFGRDTQKVWKGRVLVLDCKHTHKSKVTIDKLDEFKGGITVLHHAVHAGAQPDQSAMENDKESDCKHVVRVD